MRSFLQLCEGNQWSNIGHQASGERVSVQHAEKSQKEGKGMRKMNWKAKESAEIIQGHQLGQKSNIAWDGGEIIWMEGEPLEVNSQANFGGEGPWEFIGLGEEELKGWGEDLAGQGARELVGEKIAKEKEEGNE